MSIVKNKIRTTLPVVQVKADTIIFEEGWDDYKMFLVLEGSVKLYNERDDLEIEVAVIHKHEFFGEIEMYSHCPRATSAKMITDVKLIVIRTPIELEVFMTANNWLTGAVMQTMGSRLATVQNLILKNAASQYVAPEPVLEVTENHSIRRVIRH